MGYDLNPHPLGRFETGGRASLPVWLSYMKAALAARPQGEFWPPESFELERLRIDEKTGQIAANGATKGVKDMWFKKGTGPTEQATASGSVNPADIMSIP